MTSPLLVAGPTTYAKIKVEYGTESTRVSSVSV